MSTLQFLRSSHATYSSLIKSLVELESSKDSMRVELNRIYRKMEKTVIKTSWEKGELNGREKSELLRKFRSLPEVLSLKEKLSKIKGERKSLEKRILFAKTQIKFFSKHYEAEIRSLDMSR